MTALYVGIDLGTSGVRVCVINARGDVASEERVRFAQHEMRSPGAWWHAVSEALDSALAGAERQNVRALAVSATSGTVMALDREGRPHADVFMYADPCPNAEIMRRIRRRAPDWTPARGGNGGLGCALALVAQGPARVLHQADWINYRLTGAWFGDSSSALKTGYDPVQSRWPEWVTSLGLTEELRLQVRASGTVLAKISPEASDRFGLSADATVIAGTTDGCASFLATGASEIGDAATVLGTTLTVKLLSDQPVFAPASGVYSHLVAGAWLVGGASNSGGGVLLQYFSLEELAHLSSHIDGCDASGLDYYPLPGPGERFPIADPQMLPRLTPRPKSDAAFLHGMLDGLGAIEAAAYDRLAELGAPKVTRLFTTGGGTQNPAWMAVRERLLPSPIVRPVSVEAAYGTALLARGAP